MRAAILSMMLAAVCLFGAPGIGTAQTAPPISMQRAPAPSAEAATPAQPLAWSSLDAGQQRLLAPLRAQWNQMHPERQNRLAEHARHWATLPPERQQQIHQRLARWAAMTPEQRRAWRENARAFHNLTPAERARVREAFRKFQSLSPAERRALRARWRAMPPQKRMRWAAEHADKPASSPPAQREH